MEAIILTGGFGTRLRTVVSDLPKPMAPVNGKPFLWYIMKWLRQYPVDKIIMAAGYMSRSLVEYFGYSFLDMPVDYMVEEQPLGTGGAMKYALGKARAKSILVINGDTYFPIDLNRFYSFHTTAGSRISIALKRMRDFSRYGSIDLSGDTIIRFNEKKECREGVINGGIYFVERQFMEEQRLPDVFSLEKDILERVAGTRVLKGLEFDNTFIDIGVPEDYKRASSLLLNDRE
jgi:D-glycero-alpha-D-manno-heptose 1-phosphate guanylyltransferase